MLDAENYSTILCLIIERTDLKNLEKKHHYDPISGSLKISPDRQTSFPFLDRVSSNGCCVLRLALFNISFSLSDDSTMILFGENILVILWISHVCQHILTHPVVSYLFP